MATRRAEALPQFVEALRAGFRRVGFSRLPCHEAGLPWHRPPGQV